MERTIGGVVAISVLARAASGASGTSDAESTSTTTVKKPTTTEAATTTAAPTTTTAPTTTAPTTTTVPSSAASLELRVDGLGPLQFGMSVADAVATGFVTDPSASIAEAERDLGVSCGFGYAVDGDSAGPWVAQFVDLGYGGGVELVRIDVTTESIRTTEGLGIGSRPSEVQAVVTNASALEEGEYSGYTVIAPFRGVGYLFTFEEPDGPAVSVAAGSDEGLSLVEGCA